MSERFWKLVAVLLVFALVGAACSDDGGDEGTPDDGTTTDDGTDDGATDDGGTDDGAPDDGGTDDGGTDDGTTGDIDYEALGLWDDGPCDESLAPLVIGMITVFESPVLTLIDQAKALDAAAAAFNARGGANGACIQVVTCDDQANFDAAVACVRELDEAGVVATVNDQGSTAHEDVAAGFTAAGIPRVAANVTPENWGDPNTFPMDGSGTGSTFMMPAALISEGITDLGVIRVDLPSAGAIVGFLESAFEADGATFPADVPVPAGTTDFTQFILAVEGEGAEGAMLAIGEQEAIQVVRAGEQLGSDIQLGSSLGSFPHSLVSDLGDFATNMVFTWSFAPATVDVPVYEVLRADLAASGEETLQPLNLKASPMRSWIGLYALLYMIRDAGLTEFDRDAIRSMLQASGPVPMLDVFGGEDWDPDFTGEGVWTRTGTNHWGFYRWDPEADFQGTPGNFVLVGETSLADVLCGSLGGPCE